MGKKLKNNSILVAILLIAMVGTVMFFPLNMKSGKTCLFHRTFGGDEDYIRGHVPYAERAHAMLHRYLAPYGFIWWLSLAVVALSIYQLKKSNTKSNRESV